MIHPNPPTSTWTPRATAGRFTAHTTDIPGLLLIRTQHLADNRGAFAETYNARDFATLGITDHFVQDNQSLSTAAGVIRGLHLQTPPMQQIKLVRAIAGALLDVAVDCRKNSPTFGRHVRALLTPDSADQLYIPAGFAHGFVTLRPGSQVLYKVTNHHSPAHERGIRFDDPHLAIDWGVPPDQAILSPRDRAFESFKTFQSPF